MPSAYAQGNQLGFNNTYNFGKSMRVLIPQGSHYCNNLYLFVIRPRRGRSIRPSDIDRSRKTL
ncbi:MAG: hypothetical protein GXO83_08845 [Chlorobi bacterium]|nr:hypothetical protein [Chlorobiota bacterium]